MNFHFFLDSDVLGIWRNIVYATYCNLQWDNKTVLCVRVVSTHFTHTHYGTDSLASYIVHSETSYRSNFCLLQRSIKSHKNLRWVGSGSVWDSIRLTSSRWVISRPIKNFIFKAHDLLQTFRRWEKKVGSKESQHSFYDEPNQTRNQIQKNSEIKKWVTEPVIILDSNLNSKTNKPGRQMVWVNRILNNIMQVSFTEQETVPKLPTNTIKSTNR